MTEGYLYRLPSADVAMLRGLVRDLVTLPCWTFGGAALWDVDLNAGRENLRPITEIRAVDELDLRGDFGHAFSEAAEVRWQQRDAGRYDALVLLERPLTAQELGTTGLQAIQQCTAKAASAPIAVILTTPHELQQQGIRWQLTYVEYHAANGAVQLVRYTIRGAPREKPR